VACIALLAVFGGCPAVAQPKVGETPPVAAAQAATTEACFAGYGLNPAQKIKICSEVIDSGSAKGLALGLAHFNRGGRRSPMPATRRAPWPTIAWHYVTTPRSSAIRRPTPRSSSSAA